jgi:hypothetical protein
MCPIFQVHDSSIVIVFGGLLFEILTKVPYFYCSVTISSIN